MFYDDPFEVEVVIANNLPRPINLNALEMQGEFDLHETEFSTELSEIEARSSSSFIFKLSKALDSKDDMKIQAKWKEQAEDQQTAREEQLSYIFSETTFEHLPFKLEHSLIDDNLSVKLTNTRQTGCLLQFRLKQPKGFFTEGKSCSKMVLSPTQTVSFTFKLMQIDRFAELELKVELQMSRLNGLESQKYVATLD